MNAAELALTPNLLWLSIASLLVISMQAGFLLLEAGRVRAKNSINVAQKNISDFVVTAIAFFFVGYWLMHGISLTELSGLTRPGAAHSGLIVFLFQLGFCAAASSIISGGIAERMKYRVYMAISLVTGAFIYPIVGRWVWGDLGTGWSGSWLASLGFIDFAGSSVVHVVGASVALAGILSIGPRHGRFDDDGNVLPINGHNAVISLLGVFILFGGWFGFNAGMVAPGSPTFAGVLVNTCSSAVFGAFFGMMLGAWIDRGIFNPSRLASGMIGGLVAITASVNLATIWDAIVIGSLGGAIATWCSHWLLVRWRLDDPVDVVATHGVAGVFGTLAVAFVGSVDMLPLVSRSGQLVAQLFGVASIFVFSFTMAWGSLKLISRFTDTRVSAEQEAIGLNHAEHGEALGAERLQRALNSQLDQDPERLLRFDTDAGDDSSELAHAMNQLLQKHEHARQAISLSQTRFKQFAQTASDWLWETDSKLLVTFLSAQQKNAADMLKNQFIGASLLKVLNIRRADRAQVKAAIQARQALDPFEANLVLPNGVTLIIEVRGIPFFDANGNFVGYRGAANDVTERRAAEKRALFLSRHDELTGLSNRRALTEDVAAQIAAHKSGRGVVVAAIDLDGFKGVNDAYGHGTGDDLLREVAQRLTQALRAGDCLYRTGGDEFVVVLPGFELDLQLESGQAWANRLIDVVSKVYDIKNNKLTLGASVGLALHPEHSTEPDDLLHMADLALYAAKANGKGRVEVFDLEMDTEARHQQSLEADLREAVKNGEFYLDYQPQFSGDGHQLVAFEALIRWQHPVSGRIEPDTFIPVAERLHLMNDIGKFALEQACLFASAWPSANDGTRPLTIAVNVSPSQFVNGAILDAVGDALATSGLDPYQLELEITEQMLIDDFDQVATVLNTLRDKGIRIAIDDFGSGQTSLRYLEQFPISKIKIDRAFVSGLGSDNRANDITQSIVQMGHRLGCTVVAEGVEEPVQADLLQSWNCDQMQGFMYARPLSPDDAMQLLTRQGQWDRAINESAADQTFVEG